MRSNIVFVCWLHFVAVFAIIKDDIPVVEYTLRTIIVSHRPVSRLEFICNHTQYQNVSSLQVVSWYQGGSLKCQLQYDSTKDIDYSVLHLTESQFVEHGFSLGNKISCSIFTNANGTNHTSPVSVDFFVGIKILTPIKRIRVGETNTSKLSIRLQTTIPIGCTGTKTCAVWLATYNPYQGNTMCSVNSAGRRDICGVALHSNHSETFDIPIRIFHGGRFALQGDYDIALKTESTAENDIWKDYVLPRIKVQITNDDDTGYTDALCFNMFRVSTFDGRTYEKTAGIFTTYYHTAYKSEVQIRTTPITFNGKTVISTCGVAIKAGQGVYNVDYCGSDYNVSWNASTTNTLSVHQIARNSSKVCFPYGTCVQVSGWRLSDSVKGLVVAIQSSPADWNGKTRGLCGTYNNNCYDEFHYRPGHGSDSDPKLQNGPCGVTPNPPGVFLDSWRVGNGFDNYITGKYNLNSSIPWVFRFCVCSPVRGSFVSANIHNYIPCTTESLDVCSFK